MKRSAKLWLLPVAAALWLVLGCVTSQDDPSTVKDLRVLGMRFEPPEVLMPGCNVGLLLAAASGAADGGTIMVPPHFQALIALYASTPLEFTALIADPAGGGRPLEYRLLACANRGDRQCNDPGDYVELKAGTTSAGELSFRGESAVRPGIQLLDDGLATPLVLEVINHDTYKGLGGVRVPVVLELSAPDTGEKIFAQKLMVYTCQIFPTMKQNVTPVLPGLKIQGQPWPEGQILEISGTKDVPMEPEDFSMLEEAYVVPSLELKPVHLKESWRVTWMASSGTMSPYSTGGTDATGTTGRHNGKWKPSKTEAAQNVDFYFVVRDGRGGNSWTKRTVHWSP